LRLAGGDEPFGRPTAARRVVIDQTERWIKPGGRHLVGVSVATTEGAAKATPVSYSDWEVISRPAEKHGAETRPVFGLQTTDGAGAEQAPQLDAGYDPV